MRCPNAYLIEPRHLKKNKPSGGIWGHSQTLYRNGVNVLLILVGCQALEGLGTESICASVFFEFGHEFIQHFFFFLQHFCPGSITSRASWKPVSGLRGRWIWCF